MTDIPLVKRFSRIEAQTISLNYQKYSFENLNLLFMEGITPTYKEIAGETSGVIVLYPRCGWFSRFLATIFLIVLFLAGRGRHFLARSKKIRPVRY
jgi:hypothetical protein